MAQFSFKRVSIETVAIAVFLLVFFFLVSKNLWAGHISHTYPYGLQANDAFDHFTDTDFLLQQGNYRYLPFYISGGPDNAVTYDMPLLYHLTAIFAQTSGLRTYDAMYFLVVFLYARLTCCMLDTCACCRKQRPREMY